MLWFYSPPPPQGVSMFLNSTLEILEGGQLEFWNYTGGLYSQQFCRCGVWAEVPNIIPLRLTPGWLMLETSVQTLHHWSRAPLVMERSWHHQGCLLGFPLAEGSCLKSGRKLWMGKGIGLHNLFGYFKVGWMEWIAQPKNVNFWSNWVLMASWSGPGCFHGFLCLEGSFAQVSHLQGPGLQLHYSIQLESVPCI